MVFSSVPLYLDPPNWNNQQQQQQQQQQQHQQQLSHHGQLFASGGGGAGVEVHQHQQQHHHQQQQQHVHQQQHQLPPPGALMAPRPDTMGGGPVAVNGGGGAGGGPTSGGAAPRPGSMTDRARMAKIPQPEPGLKCPRCDSTNTKFCYFNNYSLTQPRHFCKTCRRYWTRGGALRSVPVGGGCRRNKRSKSSKSSSSAASASGGTSSSTSSTTTGGNGNSGAAAIMPPQAGHAQAQMPFFASLHPMGGGGNDQYGTGASRLGFAGLSSLDPVDYQLGGGGAAAAALGMEQWRMPHMQQFPFFGRPDGMQQQQMAGIYPFDAATDANGFAVTGQIIGGGGSKLVPGSSGLITQLASVKMEENQPSNNTMANTASAREFLGLPGNLQFWGGGNNGAGGNDNGASHSGDTVAPGGGGGSWVVDLSGSGFNSSSSGNIM